MALPLLTCLHILQSCNIDQVKINGYRNGSINNYLSTSLDNITAHVGVTFDPNKPTVFYTYGYEGETKGRYTIEVMTAYSKLTNERNIFLLDWEASNHFGAPPRVDYLLVIDCMHQVADKFAEALQKLFNHGLNPHTLQLIGLSLGAHLFGRTGRALKENNIEVGRITGCDPAYPDYDGPVRIDTPLSRTDAKFVDIIHTDPGILGMVTPTGTIDIYVNYGFFRNGTDRQPGCPLPKNSDDFFCSHNRAPQMMAASLTESDELLASKAPDYDAWIAADGAQNSVTVIGDQVNQQCSGVYYMSANGHPPYGRGLRGLRP